jgi:hypothetical protein
VGEVRTLFRCVACGADSDKLASGWRAYLAGEFDEDEQEGEVLMFCPDALAASSGRSAGKRSTSPALLHFGPVL